MRPFISFLLASLLFLLPNWANAQDRVRQTREVASFTRIAVAVPATLHLRQGTPRSVEVEATEKVLSHLEVTVDDGRLKIEDDSNFFERLFDQKEWGTIDVYVTTPTLEGVSVAGSGTVVGETPIESESLTLESAGSGEMDLDLQTSKLNVSIAGAGTVTLRGETESVTLDIAGAGTIHADELIAATADLSVAGSGDTHLHVTEQLSVKIMGSGDVIYRGSPSVETSILGTGDVRSKNE